MEELTYYIVDVFAQERYAGNQLAVFRDAGGLSDAEMQRLAKEMNYSETTFILSEQEHKGGYDVRIFTPERELPFAGHPTLGTAYVIQREIVREAVEKIILNLGVGQIPVTLHYEGHEVTELWMKQVQPSVGKILDGRVLQDVLNLDSSDIDDSFPIQEISTGTFTLVVPLKTLDALRRAVISRDKYFELVEKIDAKGILIFCPEAREAKDHLSVRFFADYLGIPEDPATGSANGCLAAYLTMHRYFGTDSIDIRVEQGHEIGRPSLLLLRATAGEDGFDINVGGRAIMVARGHLVH
jgi:trans-2,3-dihydro-3-hydroxyanthranilate isomerase